MLAFKCQISAFTISNFIKLLFAFKYLKIAFLLPKLAFHMPKTETFKMPKCSAEIAKIGAPVSALRPGFFNLRETNLSREGKSV